MFRLLTAAAAAALLAAAPSAAQAPAVQAVAAPLPTQHAALRFRIGAFDVTALSDGTLPLDVRPLLHGAPAERIDALLARNFETNVVETSINAFLVDTGERLILIDAGAGELFGAFGGRLIRSMAAAGYRP